jgi:hypothetical protein
MHLEKLLLAEYVKCRMVDVTFDYWEFHAVISGSALVSGSRSEPVAQPPFSGDGQGNGPGRGSGAPGDGSGSGLGGSGSGGSGGGGWRDPRLEWLAAGEPGDRRLPSAELVQLLEELTGPGGRVPAATANEALGLGGRWQAVEAWAQARKLALLREMIRHNGLPGGTHGGLPDLWAGGLAHEISAAFGISIPAADKLLNLAWELEARLPGIGAELEAGVIDMQKARIISDEFSVLDDERAAAAEKMILDDLAGKPPGKIGKLAQRAVDTVDPHGAVKRRKRAEREEARVRFYRDHGGAAGLTARGLPTDQALKASATVNARARAYKNAAIYPGAKMDQLRVLALCDKINDVSLDARIAMAKAEQAAAQARAEAGAQGRDGYADAGTDGPGSGWDWDEPGDWNEPGDADTGSNDRDVHASGTDSAGDHGDDSGSGDDSGGDGRGPDPGPGPFGPRGGDGPGGGPSGGGGSGGGGCRCGGPAGDSDPGLASLVNLTIPLLDLTRMADRPGEAHGLGSLDPGLCRDLANAAAQSPHSKFCVTVTDGNGYAVGHACARPTRQTGKTARTGRDGSAGQAQGPPGSSRDGPAPPGSWSFTCRDAPGPKDGYGAWTLTLSDGRAYDINLMPVPVYECDHRFQSHAYQPNGTLRHLVQVRDDECTFPTCSAHARESDFEHAIPYEKGGPTCKDPSGVSRVTESRVTDAPRRRGPGPGGRCCSGRPCPAGSGVIASLASLFTHVTPPSALRACATHGMPYSASNSPVSIRAVNSRTSEVSTSPVL